MPGPASVRAVPGTVSTGSARAFVLGFCCSKLQLATSKNGTRGPLFKIQLKALMRARAPGPAVTTGALQGGTWAGLASETPGIIPPLDLAYLAGTATVLVAAWLRGRPGERPGPCPQRGLQVRSEPTALTLLSCLVLAGPH